MALQIYRHLRSLLFHVYTAQEQQSFFCGVYNSSYVRPGHITEDKGKAHYDNFI